MEYNLGSGHSCVTLDTGAGGLDLSPSGHNLDATKN